MIWSKKLIKKLQNCFTSNKNKKYSEAVKSLNLSLKLYDEDYYADDCYYFIAYSEYNIGNYDKAKEALNTIINNYPDSSYYKDAKDLLRIIENNFFYNISMYHQYLYQVMIKINTLIKTYY